jgi:hypothetical protein
MSEIGQGANAIHARISRLTVTTGYLVKQQYSDGRWYVYSREPTRAKAVTLRNWLKSHYGNEFKIVRLYRRVRSK